MVKQCAIKHSRWRWNPLRLRLRFILLGRSSRRGHPQRKRAYYERDRTAQDHYLSFVHANLHGKRGGTAQCSSEWEMTVENEVRRVRSFREAELGLTVQEDRNLICFRYPTVNDYQHDQGFVPHVQ